MSHGSLLERLVRGTAWTWLSDRHRAALPADLADRVATLDGDRHHAKQGRATLRVRFDGPGGPLSCYLKRHDRLPWPARLAALLHPGGRHSPGAAEWAHLERARALGVDVPEAVAVGERIGPWGGLRGFLMVAELADCLPLHEAVPARAAAMGPAAFAAWKRRLVVAMVDVVARLHRAHAFHKDLYLCHFFTPSGVVEVEPRLTLIDLHRLGVHRLSAPRWRWKDLGQLLFSTFDVAGIDDRDRLRFWRGYRKAVGLRLGRWQARAIRAKAARYRAHNARATA